MKGLAVNTVLQRADGERPSRTRSFLAATFAAVTAGVLTYRLLRSG
jgi:hypothetical protein